MQPVHQGSKCKPARLGDERTAPSCTEQGNCRGPAPHTSPRLRIGSAPEVCCCPRPPGRLWRWQWDRVSAPPWRCDRRWAEACNWVGHCCCASRPSPARSRAWGSLAQRQPGAAESARAGPQAPEHSQARSGSLFPTATASSASRWLGWRRGSSGSSRCGPGAARALAAEPSSWPSGWGWG